MIKKKTLITWWTDKSNSSICATCFSMTVPICFLLRTCVHNRSLYLTFSLYLKDCWEISLCIQSMCLHTHFSSSYRRNQAPQLYNILLFCWGEDSEIGISTSCKTNPGSLCSYQHREGRTLLGPFLGSCLQIK